jgi:hypothetical protein
LSTTRLSVCLEVERHPQERQAELHQEVLLMTSFSLRRSQKSSAPSSFSRSRRVRRRFTVESLESRTLLSYTFNYDGTAAQTLTASEITASDLPPSSFPGVVFTLTAAHD